MTVTSPSPTLAANARPHGDYGHRLFIRRNDLREARIGADPDAPAARSLQVGEIRVAVDHFSLTANNITYAAFGEAMHYWQFFPSGEEGWGCLPVWGFATVCESTVAEVGVGRRLWGFWPAGAYSVLQPSRVQAHGFLDGSAHRSALATVYNAVEFCDAASAWGPAPPDGTSADASNAASVRDHEGLQAVLRPLFLTAFLLDDHLAEQGWWGAEQVLLSSASSKTAQATAFCMQQRRTARLQEDGAAPFPRVVGLSSPPRHAFVRSLGTYDEVRGYDEVRALDASVPTLYIDFAGDAGLRQTIHTHWNERLTFSSSIGGTHWSALGSGKGLPGPRPVLFFAPAQAKARSAPPPDGWGAKVLQARMAQAWHGFLAQVQAQDAVQLRWHVGPDALLAAYGAMQAGQAPAQEGWMVGV